MLFLCQLLLNFQGAYALIQVRSLSIKLLQKEGCIIIPLTMPLNSFLIQNISYKKLQFSGALVLLLQFLLFSFNLFSIQLSFWLYVLMKHFFQ